MRLDVEWSLTETHKGTFVVDDDFDASDDAAVKELLVEVEGANTHFATTDREVLMTCTYEDGPPADDVVVQALKRAYPLGPTALSDNAGTSDCRRD